MKMKQTLVGLAICAMPFMSLAQDAQTCPLSYDVYEVSVPHTDLETCPPQMEIDGAYCRVSVVAEIATVFAFSEETDCIVASRSFFEEEFQLTFR